MLVSPPREATFPLWLLFPRNPRELRLLPRRSRRLKRPQPASWHSRSNLLDPARCRIRDIGLRGHPCRLVLLARHSLRVSVPTE